MRTLSVNSTRLSGTKSELFEGVSNLRSSGLRESLNCTLPSTSTLINGDDSKVLLICDNNVALGQVVTPTDRFGLGFMDLCIPQQLIGSVTIR